MGRNVRKWIGCLGAAVMVFMADMGAVRAEGSHRCGDWILEGNAIVDCRTPICDGVHLTRYITIKRHKECTYLDTGYSYTIPDTYVEYDGCCNK